MTIKTFDNELLLQHYSMALDALEDARVRAGLIEQELMRRMREQGATAIPSEHYTCELETRNTYDASRFTPLKELLTPEDLRSAWEPQHQDLVTIPEKWTTQRLLALARRYGGEVKRIVEESRVPGTPRLRFARKGD